MIARSFPAENKKSARSVWFWLAVLLAVAFLGVSGFEMTVHGWMEPVSAFPEHYEAGAGTVVLLVRFGLALASGLAWLVALGWFRPRALWAPVPGLAFLVLFFWSTTAVEIVAEGFDESVFRRVGRVYDRECLARDWLLKHVGRPLVATGPGEGERWSYTYMPSGGFGWRKRVLVFGADGCVDRALWFSEP